MSQVATAPSSLAVLSQANAFFGSIFNAIKKNRKMRKTYNELNKLSDAELRDIGIHRSSIRAIAMEEYYDNIGDTQ